MWQENSENAACLNILIWGIQNISGVVIYMNDHFDMKSIENEIERVRDIHKSGKP